MAKIKRNLSKSMVTISIFLNEIPDWITGNKIVETDHTNAIKNIFKKGISRNLKIIFSPSKKGREYRIVSTAMGAKAIKTSFLAKNATLKNPATERNTSR